jgi:hypothetical protein
MIRRFGKMIACEGLGDGFASVVTWGVDIVPVFSIFHLT